MLSHQNNGIARGSGLLATLADGTENKSILKGKASAHYSLSKGTSRQKYPSSLMGTLALLHQSYLDAEWYAQGQDKEYIRFLESLYEIQDYAQFFDLLYNQVIFIIRND